MRWCRNCRKFNTGWPFRCRYCAAGLDGRLCPSGHVNPADMHLAFCGECGRPLEKQWGGGFSIIPYFAGCLVIIATIAAAVFVSSLSTHDALFSALVALVIVVFGVRTAFRILPPWVRSATLDFFSLLLRLVFGTGLKGGGKK
jgi:hypothetical protein